MQEDSMILYFYRIIKKNFWRLGGFVFICLLISYISVKFMDKVYRAQVTVMPVEAPAAGGGLLGAVAGAAPGGGLLSGLLGGGSNSSEQIQMFLTSRKFAVRVARKFDLKKKFFAEKWDEKAEKWLVDDPNLVPTDEMAADIFQGGLFIEFEPGNTSFIVALELLDKSIVAPLINSVMVELQEHLNEHSLTKAKRYRKFIGEQLREVRTEILELGKELANYYRDNRVSASNPSIDVPVKISGDSRSWLTIDRESLSHQLKELIEKKEKLEKEHKHKRVVTNVPQQAYLEYLTQKKVILNQVHGMLAQQYEMARIDEAQEDISFEIVDGAVTPKNPYKPKRRLIYAITVVVSGLLGLTFLVLRDYIHSLAEAEKRYQKALMESNE